MVYDPAIDAIMKAADDYAAASGLNNEFDNRREVKATRDALLEVVTEALRGSSNGFC